MGIVVQRDGGTRGISDDAFSSFTLFPPHFWNSLSSSSSRAGEPVAPRGSSPRRPFQYNQAPLYDDKNFRGAIKKLPDHISSLFMRGFLSWYEPPPPFPHPRPHSSTTLSSGHCIYISLYTLYTSVERGINTARDRETRLLMASRELSERSSCPTAGPPDAWRLIIICLVPRARPERMGDSRTAHDDQTLILDARRYIQPAYRDSRRIPGIPNLINLSPDVSLFIGVSLSFYRVERARRSAT